MYISDRFDFTARREGYILKSRHFSQFYLQFYKPYFYLHSLIILYGLDVYEYKEYNHLFKLLF